MVRVPDLPSWSSRFEPWPCQLVKAIWGICGTCKIVYDGWYKSRQRSVNSAGHISDRLSVVSVRAEPKNGYVTERVRNSSAQCQKAWLQGYGKSGLLSDWLCQKAPWRCCGTSRSGLERLDIRRSTLRERFVVNLANNPRFADWLPLNETPVYPLRHSS